MPEVNAQRGRVALAAALFSGAIITFTIAALVYTRVIDLGELRLTGTVIIGIGAFAELLVAIWFFRQGQSS